VNNHKFEIIDNHEFGIIDTFEEANVIVIMGLKISTAFLLAIDI